MTETRNAEKHERVRDLKCRLHDLSGREQLMMVAAKQADVRLHEFPELGHFFPDLHIDVKSCRAALVRFLFSKCLHYGLIFLLLIDVILVMGGLQIKIEVVALQGMAIGSCYSTALEANSSSQEHHFHGLESGMECVREQSTYEFAEALEHSLYSGFSVELLQDHFFPTGPFCGSLVFVHRVPQFVRSLFGRHRESSTNLGTEFQHVQRGNFTLDCRADSWTILAVHSYWPCSLPPSGI